MALVYAAASPLLLTGSKQGVRNSIASNVFPIPDGDTGTNFALTLRAIIQALDSLARKPVPQQLRLALVHTDAPEITDQPVHKLETRFRPRECLVARATATLAVHVGPRAWRIFYQVEQPAASGGRNPAATPTP